MNGLTKRILAAIVLLAPLLLASCGSCPAGSVQELRGRRISSR